jgi:hypothetical protein
MTIHDLPQGRHAEDFFYLAVLDVLSRIGQILEYGGVPEQVLLGDETHPAA